MKIVATILVFMMFIATYQVVLCRANDQIEYTLISTKNITIGQLKPGDKVEIFIYSLPRLNVIREKGSDDKLVAGHLNGTVISNKSKRPASYAFLLKVYQIKIDFSNLLSFDGKKILASNLFKTILGTAESMTHDNFGLTPQDNGHVVLEITLPGANIKVGESIVLTVTRNK